ncbi:hypothetical protein F5Y09DRAFT_357904 [Xylaria sp. FL1042]|nr:hypothetical protein F5Y09DRAFT_357904 [Xylaria sp. FL1042]
MTFSEVFTTVGVTLVAYLAHLGLGRREIIFILEHIEDSDIVNKTLVASSGIYLPAIFCSKASAIFLYRRLFPNKRFHIVCYIILAFTALYALISLLVLIVSCLPPIIRKAEAPEIQLKCSDQHLINILLVILIINTNLRKKLQLSLVFTLGSFIFIISIIRVVAAKIYYLDANWDSTDVELWSIAEAAVSIVTVSLPVMQPLLRRAIYRKDGTSRITTTPKASTPNQNQNSIALLMFGRSGIKGPSGRKLRGLDITTTARLTAVDTNCDGSATMVASAPLF